ncbi:MAG: hypothetical protein D6815_09790 [Candidatus Dadabacteria bacterium]|nr:MAG: hypothetical protein D6815_09790 [Candidatus Dadabacteria bacterium]
MKLRFAVSALCVAFVSAGVALASPVEEPELSAYEIPPALAKLVDAKKKDGTPVLSEKQRAYFEALPNHAKKLTAEAVAEDWITSAEHLAELLSLGLSTQKYELAVKDYCLLCHADKDFQDPEQLFSTDPESNGSPPYLNLKDYVSNVHFRQGLGCAGCHGGDRTEFMGHDFPDEWPENRSKRLADRSWIPGFCGRCHSDAAFMRQYNPHLPTDQLAKYRESKHGQVLLKDGDSRAAQCVSCHGTHDIQTASNPQSHVYAKNVPATCGKCHADPERMKGFTLEDGSPLPTTQLAEYRESVHGKALLERGDIGAAACNDCHGNHAAMPPNVASVSQICRTCHAGNGMLFDGSRHKEVFSQHGWPECDTCHGKHAIAKTSDDMLDTKDGGLCHDCHAKYAKDNPDCIATADYFHETILEFVEAEKHYEEYIEEIARKGLDVDQMTQQLGELRDAIKKARSYIHAFNMSDFREAIAPGKAALASLNALSEKAEAEYDFRRTGTFVSIAMMVLLIIVIYIKLRQMERDQ